MIDIHSHILLKIDNGSKNKEETFEMLEIEINDGRYMLLELDMREPCR